MALSALIFLRAIVNPRLPWQMVAAMVLLFAGLNLTGCRAKIPRPWPATADIYPPYHQIENVPFFPQEAYQCGPAALGMALHWSGSHVDPSILTAEVFTPSRQGSLQSAMIGAARRHGRVAYLLSNPSNLVKEIAAGHPVVVLQNLGLSLFPVWHYAVVIGYDLTRETVTLHSGKTPRLRQSVKLFDRTWARGDYWGLLVLPPSRLPATARSHEFISAVLGLEKSRQWQAAVVGYQAALSRWPESFHARMGLGNSYYALGNNVAAENEFREVIRRFPTDGSAHNNLAQVLWAQGRKEEALTEARRAVSLGGPLIELYRKTLEEIRTSPP